MTEQPESHPSILPRVAAASLALLLFGACGSKVSTTPADSEDAPAPCCEVPDAHASDVAHEGSPTKGILADDDEEDDDSELDRLAGAFGIDDGPAQVDDGTGLRVHCLLPEFELVGDDGEPFTRADMLGQVWVVDFIFTRCSGPCPEMSSHFAQFAREGLAARLLSITVDPGYDEPAVLASYRNLYGTDAKDWRLLTGSSASIQSLAERGFMLPVNADEVPVAGMPPMFHSGRFALVDAEGRVRGYYNYNDKAALRALKDDAAKLSALIPQ